MISSKKSRNIWEKRILKAEEKNLVNKATYKDILGILNRAEKFIERIDRNQQEKVKAGEEFIDWIMEKDLSKIANDEKELEKMLRLATRSIDLADTKKFSEIAEKFVGIIRDFRDVDTDHENILNARAAMMKIFRGEYSEDYSKFGRSIFEKSNEALSFLANISKFVADMSRKQRKNKESKEDEK